MEVTIPGKTADPQDSVADQLRRAVDQHYARMRRYLQHLLRDQHAADDLAQEVFVRVCRLATQGRARDMSWALVEGVMKNVLREHFRRGRRTPDPLGNSGELPDFRSAPPAELAEQEDTRSAVQALIARLGPLEQRIVVGRHYWGLNGVQLAELLHMPRTTLIGRYNSAMDTLRGWMEECGLTPSEDRHEP